MHAVGTLDGLGRPFEFPAKSTMTAYCWMSYVYMFILARGKLQHSNINILEASGSPAGPDSMAATFSLTPAALHSTKQTSGASVSPSARFRLQCLTFKQGARGQALKLRTPAEVRAQRAAVITHAAAEASDAEESDFERDNFEERVVQVRRVTKVVKGGKQLSFRAVVVVGDGNGTVGVGCDSAKEVAQAVRKAVTNAKRNLVTVPLSKNNSFPHRFEADFKSAKVCSVAPTRVDILENEQFSKV